VGPAHGVDLGELCAQLFVDPPYTKRESDEWPPPIPQPKRGLQHPSQGSLPVRAGKDRLELVVQADLLLHVVDRREDQPPLRAEVGVDRLDRYACAARDLVNRKLGPAFHHLARCPDDALAGGLRRHSSILTDWNGVLV